MEGGRQVATGDPLAPVSETAVENRVPKNPVPPAWEGDPSGETNLAQICYSDTWFPAAPHHNPLCAPEDVLATPLAVLVSVWKNPFSPEVS